MREISEDCQGTRRDAGEVGRRGERRGEEMEGEEAERRGEKVGERAGEGKGLILSSFPKFTVSE